MDIIAVDRLPFDILIEIFQYLPLEDLVFSVQHVNRFWQNVAQDTVLWRDIHFKPSFGMNTEYVKALLKEAPMLRSFEFREGLKVNEILETLFEHNRNIVSLAFDSCEILSPLMMKLIVHYPNLEYLQLPLLLFVTHITFLGKFKHLRKVKCVQVPFHNNFFGNRRYKKKSEDIDWCALEELYLPIELVDDRFEVMITEVRSQLLSLELQTIYSSKFLNHVKKCSKLEKLKLGFMSRQMEYPDLGYFFGELKNLVKLKYLHLSSFVHADVNVLCNVFQKAKFPYLAEISLPNCVNFSQRVAQSVVAACPGLEIIRMKGCVVLDDLCLREFGLCVHLSILDISGCPGISDVGLKYLTSCHHLSELNLNWIGFVSLSMAQQIGEMKSLAVLHLDHTDINTSHLVSTITHLPHLKLLSVYSSPNVDGEHLQEMLPRCLVRYSKKDSFLILKEKATVMQKLHVKGISENILKVLPDCQNLEELRINFLGKPSPMFFEICSFLKSFDKLKTISLNNIVVPETEQLYELLSGWLHLCVLELKNCLCFNDHAAMVMASHNPRLQRLDLTGCVSLNENGLSFISKLEGLQMLDISGCSGISETGLSCLSDCKYLSHLNLCGLLLSAVPVDILNHLLSMPKLQNLCLQNNDDLEKFMNSRNWSVSTKRNDGMIAIYEPS